MESSVTHIRPRFKLTVPYPKEDVWEKTMFILNKYKGTVKAKTIDDHIMLQPVENEIHYWLPQLDFRVEQDEDFPKYTSIAGLIGPLPKVWTLFVFIYFSLGIIEFFISSYGVSKWMLDEYSPTIWAFPVAALLMLTAYRVGKYGESLGKKQIEQLKQLISEIVEIEKLK